ncbi:MAG: tetratricopeptide repeat protein, partial [Steroidobacteraceae bacterium]
MAAPLELQIAPIRELMQGHRFADALRALDALPAAQAEEAEALYLRAVSQRMLGETAAALATLTTLEGLHPRFSRLSQERGYCYVALKRAPEAIEAFLRAVHSNPALPASWQMLEGLYRMTGRAADAATAGSHVATLKKLPAAVVTATALFHDGELAQSEQ